MNMDTLEEVDTLPDEEVQRRLEHTRDLLWRTGAHYVIDDPIELLGVIDNVNVRLARGEDAFPQPAPTGRHLLKD